MIFVSLSLSPSLFFFFKILKYGRERSNKKIRKFRKRIQKSERLCNIKSSVDNYTKIPPMMGQITEGSEAEAKELGKKIITVAADSNKCFISLVEKWQAGIISLTADEAKKMEEIGKNFSSQAQNQETALEQIKNSLKEIELGESEIESIVQEFKQVFQKWEKTAPILNNLIQKSNNPSSPSVSKNPANDSNSQPVVDNQNDIPSDSNNQPTNTIPNRPIPANKPTTISPPPASNSAANQTANLGIEKKKCSTCEKVTFHRKNQCMPCSIKEELKNADKKDIETFREDLEAKKSQQELEAKRLQENVYEKEARLLREYNAALLREVRGGDSKNSSNKNHPALWVVLVIALLAVAGLIGYIFWSNKKKTAQ